MGTPSTEQIGSVPRCNTCGSEQVTRNGQACFNADSGLWELETLLDSFRCQNCQADATLVWVAAEHPPHLRIRELNDRFRTQGLGTGTLLLTQGIRAGGQAFVHKVVAAVQSFDAFNDDNDPWGEHDFGAIDVEGENIFFKFDYYAPDLKQGSENPANEGVTHRVLTLMLAHEY